MIIQRATAAKRIDWQVFCLLFALLAVPSFTCLAATVTELQTQTATLSQQITTNRNIIQSEKAQFEARQSKLATDVQKTKEHEQSVRTRWAQNNQLGETVLALQEWIENNLVTPEGYVPTDHPKYQQYLADVEKFQQTKQQLLGEVQQVRVKEASNEAEASRIIEKAVQIQAMVDDLENLKAQLAEKQIALDNAMVVQGKPVTIIIGLVRKIRG